MSDLRLFVWRGAGVLKNYNSGMVIVAARDVDDAMAKLKAEDFQTWAWLRYGITYVTTQWELDYSVALNGWPDYTMPDPEVFTLNTLPPLFLAGGE